MKMKKLNKIAAAAVCGLALVPFNISAAADDTPLFSFPFETETSEAETTAVITDETVISSEVISTTEIPVSDLVTTSETDDIADIEDAGEEEIAEIDEDGSEDTADDLSDLFPSGNGKLIEDVTDDAVNREFITIQSKNGNSFFIIIDRNSKKEGNVYFLNLVDEYDLLAFKEQFPENAPVEVNTDKKTDTKADKTADSEDSGSGSDADTKETAKPDNSGGNNSMILIIGAVALIGGGAFYYFKIYKKKPKQPKAPQYDEDEDDAEEETVNEDSPDVMETEDSE
jgi:hypothetical protein